MSFINTLFTVGEINLLVSRRDYRPTLFTKNTDKCYKCSRCKLNFQYRANRNEHEYCWH